MSRMRRFECLSRQRDFRFKNSPRHDRRLRFETLEDRRLLAVVTVGNDLDLANGNTSSISSLLADDGGDGISLREAIAAANASPGSDTITFALSGQVITPGSALPMITDSVVIDATTAPGYAGEPLVILDGLSAGTATGLHLSASAPHSEIHGLSIIRFTDGIVLESNDNVVSQNYVGIGASGGIGGGNAYDGVRIDDATGNLITQNVISGNFRHGLFIIEGGANTVTGNRIGTDATGLMADGNTADGIQIANSSNNQIGGIVDADRNIVSGNRDGITIIGDFAPASFNKVQGNYVGTDVTGLQSIPNLFDGIQLWNVMGAATDSVTGNIIGGDDDDDGALDGIVRARNVISGNMREGVSLFGSQVTLNRVEGNWIGLTADGQAPLPNLFGINISKPVGGAASEAAFSNIIGGTAAGAGNVISGNTLDGIQLAFGSFANFVLGNFIGTDISGGADPNAPLNLGNSRNGITISDGNDNIIGGVTVAERNVIAGNLGHGVAIKKGDLNLPTLRNQVLGNYIGVLIDGTTGLGNTLSGVFVEESGDNFIGGTAVGAGNLISANKKAGVEIGGTASTNNRVQGNHIGTTADGSAALPNEFGVVILISASANIIGGDSTLSRNVISGNTEAGVLITGVGTDDNKVQWNLIGTNDEGSGAIANRNGIRIEDGASNNSIGGIDLGNVISGNTEVGVFLGGATTTDNKIKGNSIGASVTEFAIANGSYGIFIRDANDTMIGGTDDEDGTADQIVGAGNVIAFNGTSLGVRGHGVVVESGTGNAIRGNSIYKNEGRGIDLGNDSFTLDDQFGTIVDPLKGAHDLDTGANNLQNYGFVRAVSFDDTQKQVDWILYSTPNTEFIVEYFSSDELDPSGFGEGQRFLIAGTYTTDENGFLSHSVTTVSDNSNLAITVTDPSGNTSEFSMVDTDGDAIADAWESPGLGIDFDEDGMIDLDLWEKGARPDKKDVLVEIDAMDGFAPSPTVLDWVKNGRPEIDEGFSQVPADLVQNPDGSTGINLIWELDETITASRWTGDANGDGQTAAAGDTADQGGFPFFDQIKANTSPNVAGGFGTKDERKSPETIAAKRLVYHYTIFADQFAISKTGGGVTNGTSGIAELFGNDVIVSLGAWDKDGTPEQRAGTFMHELGHNLGLRHGGSDSVNYKPNYHSVMNYTWQSPKPGYKSSWQLDYSREKRATLSEILVSEDSGLGGNPAYKVPIGPIKDALGNTIPEQLVAEGGAVDLNGNGTKNDLIPFRDLNYISHADPSPEESLFGHVDWSGLYFFFRASYGFADGVAPDISSDEITLDIDLGLDSIGIGPGAIQFTHSQFEVDESGTFAEIRVVRTGGKDGEVSVDYDFVADSATAGQDFTPLSGTITFAHAEYSKIIQIPILGDLVTENDETVSLTLSNPTNGAALGTRAESELVIIDDDNAGQLQFLLPSQVVDETAGMLNVTVERIGGTLGAITVDFELEDGTAFSTHDYVDASGTLTFADGQSSQIITVQISDDGLGEGSEYFNVTLSNPTGGASLGNPSTTAITIGDNETPIVVTNTNNSGGGSLRQAIHIANARPGVDSIAFRGEIFNTPQTISLTTGEIDISEAVTINGPGQELITLQAGQESRIFRITATTGDFILAGFSLTGGEVAGEFDAGKGGAIRSDTNGNLTIERSTVSGSSTTGRYSEGGGIYSRGDLTLINSIVSGNSTAGDNADGGGIYSRGDMTLIGSSISGNSTAGTSSEGGGVYSLGDMTLISSTIIGNRTTIQLGFSAGSGGGGIHSRGYTTLIDSIVSGNSTAEQYAKGGGIYSLLGLTLISSTVSGNSTTGNSALGGGIYSYYNVTLTDSTVSGNSTAGAFFAEGGGIHANYNVTLTRSTVSGNSTAGDFAVGGGIIAYNVTLIDSTVSGNSTAGSDADGGGIIATAVTLTNSTVTDNHAYHATATGGGILIGDSIVISGSIVAGNTAGGGMNDIDPITGSIQANFSLIEQTGLTINGGDNIIGQAANLGPLADNGGPTETHSLLPGSPAIDAGDPAILFDANEFDQRGAPFVRVVDGGVAGLRIDMGAFEVQPIVAPADFDSDGDVDGRDFLAWQRGFGIQMPNAVKADGDADNDLDVDGDDLGVWQQQYGTGQLLAVSGQQLAREEDPSPQYLRELVSPEYRGEGLLADSPSRIVPTRRVGQVSAAELVGLAMAKEWREGIRETVASAMPLTGGQSFVDVAARDAVFALDYEVGRPTRSAVRGQETRAQQEQGGDDDSWSEEVLEQVFG